VIAQGRANLPRNDLAAAGVQGAGFAIPVAALDKAVTSAVENGEIEPKVLAVTSLSGGALAHTTAPTSPNDLMGLLALSIAFQVMNAPNSGDPVDLY
jgi:S1-C subfamily serine protease